MQPAAHHQLHRARLADEAREPLRAARAGQHAERDLGQADLAAVLPRDAEVRGHRHLEAAADGVAVQRGDHELRRLLEAVERLVGVQAEVVLELGIGVLEHADRRAGAEELLARAGEHDDVDGRVHARVEDRRRRARASSRSCRCWPAARRASAPTPRRAARRALAACRDRYAGTRYAVRRYQERTIGSHHCSERSY